MGDIPAARTQYGRWLAAMASCTADRVAAHELPGGFRPLLLGLHWPSQAWGDEELGAASFDALVGGSAGEPVVDGYAPRLADTPATRRALQTIVRAALRDVAPTTLPPEVRQAYEVIDAEAGAGATGAGAAPGDDRDPFDPEATYQACQVEDLVSFGGPVLGGILAPLRVLTFWHMKRRARLFGERGAADLLSELQRATPSAYFHVMGHSFGCIVAAAAIAGPAEPPAQRPAVRSLTLAQGAMSLWSFCSSIPAQPQRSGYFRRVVADGLVNGTILITTSVHDRAVRTFYPLGAAARSQVDYRPGDLPTYGGIGAFGARGPGIDIVDADLLAETESYELSPRVVYNLRADEFIATGGGVMGAHSDIAQPAVAHALWQAVTAGRR